MIHHRLTGEQSLTKHKLPASLFERQEGLLQREPLVSDQMLFSCPVAVNKQRTARLHTRTHSLGGRVGCMPARVGGVQLNQLFAPTFCNWPIKKCTISRIFVHVRTFLCLSLEQSALPC